MSDTTMVNLPIAASPYQYSAIRIEYLGATEYTLVTVVVDLSTSVDGFVAEISRTLTAVVESCKKSPRAENLLLRVLAFNDRLHELHGFKPLAAIDTGDYDNLVAEGMTALHAATFSAIGATLAFAKDLTAQDFNVNGITFIITDGGNNRPGPSPAAIAELKRQAARNEDIESLLAILIGVNLTDRVACAALTRLEQEACLDAFIDIGDASPERLARLARFVSKSVSAQSQSLGTGGPSQLLTW